MNNDLYLIFQDNPNWNDEPIITINGYKCNCVLPINLFSIITNHIKDDSFKISTDKSDFKFELHIIPFNVLNDRMYYLLKSGDSNDVMDFARQQFENNWNTHNEYDDFSDDEIENEIQMLYRDLMDLSYMMKGKI